MPCNHTILNSGECCNKICESLFACANDKLHGDSPTSPQRKFLMCTQLNLSRSNIQNCDCLLLGLERLKVLDLSHNEIKELPNTCKSMRILDHVNMSHNLLTKFPEWILLLKNASTINLGNNPLCRSFQPHFMKAEWEKVELSSLENLNLVAIPDCILKSRFLCTFIFGSLVIDKQCKTNCMWSIPDHLPASVTTIDFCQINLTSLDHNWQVYSKLRTFSAQGNELFWIPDNFVHLNALEECNLSSCGLFLLPNAFGNLANLRVLNLSFNKLTTIPKSCELLVHLEQFDLYDNRIETVPCDLQLLKCLKGCDLWLNYLDPNKFLPRHGEMCQEMRTKFNYDNRLCDVQASPSQEAFDNCSTHEQNTESSDSYEEDSDSCFEKRPDWTHLDPPTEASTNNLQNGLGHEESWVDTVDGFSKIVSIDQCEESWDDAINGYPKIISTDLSQVRTECEDCFHPAVGHAATQVSSPSVFPIVEGQFDDD